jgi:hypothetical protein
MADLTGDTVALAAGAARAAVEVEDPVVLMVEVAPAEAAQAEVVLTAEVGEVAPVQEALQAGVAAAAIARIKTSDDQ